MERNLPIDVAAKRILPFVLPHPSEIGFVLQFHFPAHAGPKSLALGVQFQPHLVGRGEAHRFVKQPPLRMQRRTLPIDVAAERIPPFVPHPGEIGFVPQFHFPAPIGPKSPALGVQFQPRLIDQREAHRFVKRPPVGMQRRNLPIDVVAERIPPFAPSSQRNWLRFAILLSSAHRPEITGAGRPLPIASPKARSPSTRKAAAPRHAAKEPPNRRRSRTNTPIRAAPSRRNWLRFAILLSSARRPNLTGAGRPIPAASR